MCKHICAYGYDTYHTGTYQTSEQHIPRLSAKARHVYVYDVTYVYDDVTYVYDDVTYVSESSSCVRIHAHA